MDAYRSHSPRDQRRQVLVVGALLLLGLVAAVFIVQARFNLFIAAPPPPSNSSSLRSYAAAQPQDAPIFPAGNGREVFLTRCSICHSTALVADQPPLTAAVWTKEVNKMRTVYGAPVPETDIAVIAQYLAAVHGPSPTLGR
ncbi:MAG: hypothetical protein ACYC6M_08890 [Terriglobales bacterium]